MNEDIFKAYKIVKIKVITFKYKEFIDKITTLLLIICIISTMLIALFKYNNIQMNPLTLGCIMTTSMLIPICCYCIKNINKELKVLDNKNLS